MSLLLLLRSFCLLPITSHTSYITIYLLLLPVNKTKLAKIEKGKQFIILQTLFVLWEKSYNVLEVFSIPVDLSCQFFQVCQPFGSSISNTQFDIGMTSTTISILTVIAKETVIPKTDELLLPK